MTGSKVCSKCHEEKALSEFGSNKRRPDGKQTYCKECARADARNRRKSGVSQHLVSENSRDVTGEGIILTRFPPEN